MNELFFKNGNQYSIIIHFYQHIFPISTLGVIILHYNLIENTTVSRYYAPKKKRIYFHKNKVK